MRELASDPRGRAMTIIKMTNDARGIISHFLKVILLCYNSTYLISQDIDLGFTFLLLITKARLRVLE